MGKNRAMKITVIVPTYLRTQDLARCLAALQQQQRFADQLILVVRDTDSQTKEFLANHQDQTLPLEIATVTVPGVVAAMNQGLDKAEGEIICFTDDDSAPEKDWLAKIETYFLTDDKLGGLGGKDNVYHGTQKEEGAAKVVGKITWFGKIIGNHHMGIGSAREVDILKGVNMSFRAKAIEGLRFDSRLRGSGAQAHLELPFCLSVKRRGWKLIYDPQIVVNHYVAQRFDEDQRNLFNSTAFSNSVYNETIAILEHFSFFQKIIFFIWSFLVGTKKALGLLQWVRFLPKEKQLATQKMLASISARWQAFTKK